PTIAARRPSSVACTAARWARRAAVERDEVELVHAAKYRSRSAALADLVLAVGRQGMASLNAIPRVPCPRILVAQSCYDSSLKITLVPQTGAVGWRGPGSETTMRTLIQGGWVVGYNNGGHELIPNGCVLFEDDRVV